MRDLLFDEDEVRGTVLPVVPEILPGPVGEKKADAIARANRSEALRANDLRQFVKELDIRNREADVLRQEWRTANARRFQLETLLAASTSMTAIKEVTEHLRSIESSVCKARDAMERAK